MTEKRDVEAGSWNLVIAKILLTNDGITRKDLKGKAFRLIQDPRARERKSDRNTTSRLAAGVTAILRLLERAGIIERQGDVLKIVDRAGLVEMIDSGRLPFDRIKDRESGDVGERS